MNQLLAGVRTYRLDALVGKSSRSGQLLARAAVTLGVLGAAGQGVLHLLNVTLFDLSVGALNADADVGVFMWASTGATFTAAVAAAGLGLVVRPARVGLYVLAALLFLLSLDDSLGLHERVASLQPTIGGLEHASRLFWPIATMPLLAVVAVGLWLVSRSAEGLVRRALRLGLLALVAAVVCEMATPALFALGSDHGELAYESEVVLEEGLELFGWAAIAGGLLGLLLDAALRDEA